MPINYDEYLRASNGTGEAVRANVVLERPVGSTEINVDSVLNWPSKFIATSGMLDNATGTFDPATVTVFFGHLNGTYIEIDEFAPGYPDRGNDENEIIVLKPTTSWADKIAGRVALPVGGTVNQVLTKNSSTNGDASWKDAGGNSTWVFNEVPSGAINGTNPTFTLANAASSVILVENGIVLRPGVGNDYTLSGSTITMLGTSIPAVGSNLTATYTTSTSAMITGTDSPILNETPSGTINGTNPTFTTSKPYIGGTLQVYRNGLRELNGSHFTETTPGSGIFTFSDAPVVGDNISVSYVWSASATANADTVDGFNANATPIANTIPVLDASARALWAIMPAGVVRQLGYNSRGDVVTLTSGTTANTWYNVKNAANSADLTVVATTTESDIYVEVTVATWFASAAYKYLRATIDGTIANITPDAIAATYLTDQVTPANAVFKFSSVTPGSHTFGMQLVNQAAGGTSYRTATIRVWEVKS